MDCRERGGVGCERWSFKRKPNIMLPMADTPPGMFTSLPSGRYMSPPYRRVTLVLVCMPDKMWLSSTLASMS
jgi:hypothetical protein